MASTPTHRRACGRRRAPTATFASSPALSPLHSRPRPPGETMTVMTARWPLPAVGDDDKVDRYPVASYGHPIIASNPIFLLLSSHRSGGILSRVLRGR
ncbi:unnamed protein product [Urochloa humidicola]